MHASPGLHRMTKLTLGFGCTYSLSGENGGIQLGHIARRLIVSSTSTFITYHHFITNPATTTTTINVSLVRNSPQSHSHSHLYEIRVYASSPLRSGIGSASNRSLLRMLLRFL
ncbi:hypothetical protein RJT34_32355 [Clitoria ternatea]|uniref:Uncharacterized protein n=1 Tax=Clitoria ternatea TaxID=43366 RepID=A0AAN9I5U5_CLITE